MKSRYAFLHSIFHIDLKKRKHSNSFSMRVFHFCFQSFPEKLLVLGRRMIGNYRQFVYLMRYQLKRGRYVLFSFLRVQNRFRSTIWRLTKKVIRQNTNIYYDYLILFLGSNDTYE